MGISIPCSAILDTTMDVHTNIPLKNYTTMKLGGNARFMTDVHSIEDIQMVAQQATAEKLPIFVLGGGSNTIVRDEGFNGLVLRNRIMGYEVIEDTAGYTIIRVGAGEEWDSVVKRTVEANLSGIEALSAIPGTAGAAPVQNIGAYGQEVADVLTAIEVYDLAAGQVATLAPEDCQFSYRSSIFRESAAGQYVITHIVIRLAKASPAPPFYRALEDYFSAHAITFYTPQVVRDAVMSIRFEKLPDPTERPNSGSFFKNAVIEDWQYQELIRDHPDMPSYPMPDNHHKIPTGWLIEQVGCKGQLFHGMRVHDKNALVLINESATSYADLAAARDEIRGRVRDIFRISIEQEPLEI